MSFIDGGSGEADDLQDRLGKAGPVAATIGSDGTCKVVVSGSKSVKVGSVFPLRGSPRLPLQDLRSLLAAKPASGDAKARPGTGTNEVVVFGNALVDDGALVVGRPACRVHDGMAGNVQVAYALACPSATTVNKKGVLQSMSIVDPASARVVSDVASLADAAAAAFGRDWPGGQPGFILRNRASGAKFVMAEEAGRKWESPAAFADRIGVVNEFFAGGAKWDAIPIWRLPMGREQAMRERLPPGVDAKQVSGAFSKTYPVVGSFRAFAPSLLVLGDEEEWAFGGPTGKSRRVVLAAHPIHPGSGHAASDVKTPATSHPQGPKPWGFVTLYGKDAMEALAKDRASRRPADAPAAVRATGTGAPSRADSYGGGRYREDDDPGFFATSAAKPDAAAPAPPRPVPPATAPGRGRVRPRPIADDEVASPSP